MINKNNMVIQTMIGEDTVVDGPIDSKSGVIIYGSINGKVDTKGPVRIAKNAVVNGDVIGKDIRIGGTVNGDIISNGQVTLVKTCYLKGDITYRKLHIEDGAQFEGKCEILKDEI